MPFPWKKVKVTRITQMVSDLQSPKRGGSLVVETGFPTSLIDLFVKNRDKLKRPSIKKKKKKKKNKPTSDAVPRDPPPVADDPPPVSDDPPPFADDPIATDSNEDDEIVSPPSEAEAEKELAAAPAATVAMAKTAEIATAKTAETARRRSPEVVFLAAMRVFAVAALALSTKKLVIGVTLSAFVLLLLELVGKRLVAQLMRPFAPKRDDGDESEEEEFIAVRQLIASEPEPPSPSPSEEAFRPELELLSRDRKWGVLDSNCEEQISAVEKTKTRSKSAKIRRKIIKNFVPKKLRSSMKPKKASFVETFEEEERHESGIVEICEAEEVEEDAIESPALSVEDEEEVAGAGDGAGGKEENWVVVTTLVVVLLGLFGGRIFALLFTVTWCFAMKVIGIGSRNRSAS